MAHGDFYFAINATFYHFTERWGPESLIAYWQGIGRDYLAPLGRQLAAGGPPAVAKHWADYFAGEPGGDVSVTQEDERRVLIDVKDCPALSWLRNSRDAAIHVPPHPMFCGHCLHINTALAEGMGWTFELEGGGGSCRQWFREGEHSERSETRSELPERSETSSEHPEQSETPSEHPEQSETPSEHPKRSETPSERPERSTFPQEGAQSKDATAGQGGEA